jgi:hypothetical protein
MSNFAGQNINRVNAVKQLAKGIRKDENEDIDIEESIVRFTGAFVNAFIYYIDVIKEANDLKKKEFNYEIGGK